MRPTFLLALSFLNILALVAQPVNKGINTYQKIDYDLSSPDKVYALAQELREISGITEVDGSTIACIQDELGIIYFFDLIKNETVSRINFEGGRDIEDITRVGETFYAIRSDKKLYEIKGIKSGNLKVEHFTLDLPDHNFESLCYDRKNNRLLLAPKMISKEDSENKERRFIYGFDLAARKLIKGAVMEFELKFIKRFCLENGINVPFKEKKKGKKEEPDIKFRISALGIHPLTNKLFIISGMEQMLFVFEMNGNLEYVEKLKYDLFPQPEGITFMSNGDMLISNEGRNGVGTILRFNYRPSAVRKTTK